MKSKLLLVFPLALATAMLLATPSAQSQVFTAFMDGPSESPPNNSPATGFATITLDLALHTLLVEVNWTGLQGTASIAHIHGPTVDPLTGTASPATNGAGFPGLPATTSGDYEMLFNTLDAATWNASYVNTHGGGTLAGTEAAFAQHLAEGRTYFNLHSTEFPGGEIRGFLVPEPGTVGLIALGGIALLFAARKARKS